MNKARGILLITTLTLTVITTACMGHHPLLFGCTFSIDPANCNLVQGPVSIESGVDTVPGIAPYHEDSVPDGLKGHGETTLDLSTWQLHRAKGPPYFVGVGDTILLRIKGQIQYIAEVRWHSSDKRVATVEPWLPDQALVLSRKAGIATISVNVSGQRDSVPVTVSANPVQD